VLGLTAPAYDLAANKIALFLSKPYAIVLFLSSALGKSKPQF